MTFGAWEGYQSAEDHARAAGHARARFVRPRLRPPHTQATIPSRAVVIARSSASWQSAWSNAPTSSW